jgi:hypothetical protein
MSKVARTGLGSLVTGSRVDLELGRARAMIPVSGITCERTRTHTGMHPDTRLARLTRQSIIDQS